MIDSMNIIPVLREDSMCKSSVEGIDNQKSESRNRMIQSMVQLAESMRSDEPFAKALFDRISMPCIADDDSQFKDLQYLWEDHLAKKLSYDIEEYYDSRELDSPIKEGTTDSVVVKAFMNILKKESDYLNFKLSLVRKFLAPSIRKFDNSWLFKSIDYQDLFHIIKVCTIYYKKDPCDILANRLLNISWKYGYFRNTVKKL